MADTSSRAAHTASLSFSYAEPRARVVADAVSVEVDQIVDERSRATVERDAGEVRVHVEAADLVALRAAINTWVRLVETAETVASTAATHR